MLGKIMKTKGLTITTEAKVSIVLEAILSIKMNRNMTSG